MPNFSPPGRLLPYTSVDKQITQYVTSSTTLVNDDELHLSVLAGKVYEVEINIIIQGTTGNSTLKIGFTGPSGAAFTWTYDAPMEAAGGTSTSKQFSVLQIGSTSTTICFSANDVWSTVRGRLTVAATAGELQLRMAQGTTSVNPTGILAGSWMRMIQVA